MFKEGVFSGPYFPVFGLKNTDQEKFRIWTLFTQCKIETLSQVFSSEFCEILKNIFLREYHWATASVHIASLWQLDETSTFMNIGEKS